MYGSFGRGSPYKACFPGSCLCTMHLADQFLIALGHSFFGGDFCFKVIENNYTHRLCRNAFFTVNLWRLEVAGHMSLGDSVWHSLNFAARVKV